MPVMIKFYMVVGRDENYENVIRNVVSEIREKFKGSERNVNATFIRIKPEAVDAALNALSMPESQVPQNLIYLVKSMKQDGVASLPALIINGKKIYEGQLPPPDTVKQTVMDEVMTALSPPQAPPQPAQVAPPPPPQPPSTPPPPPIQLPPPPPPPPQVETKPQTTEAIEVQPLRQVETTVSERPQLPSLPTPQTPLPSGVKIVVGRPNDCRECVYYGANTGVCLLFGYRIVDPTKPPCKSA
ncbi:hypothetical protein VMUT_1731 [Vulcanisaeta moutnovskia 768-28]|uniref:Thioredoxin-like fold domain-containing protein n=2 Tax=Vulcanisaeta TaxID=164450 RepID=F0QUV1_VULM7|nr:hypothetical protein VMUT_1731 [Vulcanisaeta moutnovskia 768-28]